MAKKRLIARTYGLNAATLKVADKQFDTILAKLTWAQIKKEKK